MAREKAEIQRTPITVRVDTPIVDRLDQYIQEERERTGYAVERSDMIRRAILELLERAGSY